LKAGQKVGDEVMASNASPNFGWKKPVAAKIAEKGRRRAEEQAAE
jgi:hypothetical protein